MEGACSRCCISGQFGGYVRYQVLYFFFYFGREREYKYKYHARARGVRGEALIGEGPTWNPFGAGSACGAVPN
jgi:hypothetical protein